MIILIGMKYLRKKKNEIDSISIDNQLICDHETIFDNIFLKQNHPHFPSVKTGCQI